MKPVATPRLSKYQRIGLESRVEIATKLLPHYQSGSSIRDLATNTGYSISRVRGLLEDAGVQFRGR